MTFAGIAAAAADDVRDRPVVLTVDDEPDVRFLCRMNLEPAGFTVYEARNGAEALDLLESSDRITVVLLDVMMPVMDGWELLERMQSDPRLSGIPVVMFSARLRCMTDRPTDGAAGYVEKPFSPSKLIETIRGVMS